MAVKALIKRHFRKDLNHDAHYHNAELRALATVQPGYISGQTMVDMNNSDEMIIISTWESKDDWDNWHNSTVRKDYYKKLRFLLESEEEISFYSVGARR